MRADERSVSPGMTAPELLQARPAALGWLESRGIDPWLDPSARLDSLAAARRIPWAEFAAALENPPQEGPRPSGDTALPDLLDHLIADHRDILGRIVPAIASALADSPGERVDAGVDGLKGAWKAFAAGLEAHMREEETFLFPRLLEYAYSLRHHGHHPDFAGGSVNVYIAIRLLGNEHAQVEALGRFFAGRDALSKGPALGWPRQERLARLLDELRTRLEAHTRMEQDTLFPKARELEKSLYDAAIAGADAGKP